MKVLLATSSVGNFRVVFPLVLDRHNFLHVQQVDVQAFWEIILKRWENRVGSQGGETNPMLEAQKKL